MLTNWAGSAGPLLAILDQFTGSDGTFLSAHTPDVGGPYNVFSGNGLGGFAQLSGNKLVRFSSAPLHGINLGRHDAEMGITWRTSSLATSGVWGLAGRFSSSLSLYTVSLNPNTGRFAILERGVSSDTELAGATVSVSVDTDYYLWAKFDGTTITARLDGANEISAAVAAPAAESTFWGVRLGASVVVTLDDFWVR